MDYSILFLAVLGWTSFICTYIAYDDMRKRYVKHLDEQIEQLTKDLQQLKDYEKRIKMSELQQKSGTEN